LSCQPTARSRPCKPALETIQTSIGPFSGAITVAVGVSLPPPPLAPAGATAQGTTIAIANANYIVMGDVDNDNDNDFIAITYGGLDNILHTNTAVTISQEPTFPPRRHRHLRHDGALGDIDNDGDLDLVEAAVLNPISGNRASTYTPIRAAYFHTPAPH